MQRFAGPARMNHSFAGLGDFGIIPHNERVVLSNGEMSAC